MTELWAQTATEVASRIRNREVSALEVCTASLERLDVVNPAINAVVQRTDEEAIATAKTIDDALARGEDPRPLAGVPVTIKENVDQTGYPTTNGLRIQADLIATKDNPVVANLKRAGAVIVGRTNTPAFSLRWFTRNSLHGHTRNPVNRALTPGGSSGGASAAVASGICAIGHGSDIGGSIRYPAYACGIQGLRPTFGRVPAVNFSGPDRHIGGQLMAVSGPLARSISDLRLALAAMSAEDIRDPWWVPAPLNGEEKPKRAALSVAPDDLDVQPEVEHAVRAAAERLRDAGWEIDEVECPPFREPARLQGLLWLSEMRRHGGQAIIDEADPDATFVYEQLTQWAPEPSMNDLLDAVQRRVTLIREWNAFLDTYPVLICPVSGELPFEDLMDVKSVEDFDRVGQAQLTQIGLPLLGLPGLSVFTGMTEGIPSGAQLIAARFREDILFDAAIEIEARSPTVKIATPDAVA